MTTTDEAAARIEATIHLINNHWWNGRRRPEAPDLRALLDERDRLLASQERAIAEAVERCAKVAEREVSALYQWRTTIMVRFDGAVDHEQWCSLNRSFDRAINAPAAIRNLKGTEQ